MGVVGLLCGRGLLTPGAAIPAVKDLIGGATLIVGVSPILDRGIGVLPLGRLDGTVVGRFLTLGLG